MLLVKTLDWAYVYARRAYFVDQIRPWLRAAIEFRHASWHNKTVFSPLLRHGAAYCVMNGALP